MTISELIAALETARDAYGDVEVRTFCSLNYASGRPDALMWLPMDEDDVRLFENVPLTRDHADGLHTFIGL